ncbi:hypothetical protein THAOC_23680, partial [Thalassiosira oceanica]
AVPKLLIVSVTTAFFPVNVWRKRFPSSKPRLSSRGVFLVVAPWLKANNDGLVSQLLQFANASAADYFLARISFERYSSYIDTRRSLIDDLDGEVAALAEGWIVLFRKQDCRQTCKLDNLLVANTTFHSSSAQRRTGHHSRHRSDFVLFNVSDATFMKPLPLHFSEKRSL